MNCNAGRVDLVVEPFIDGVLSRSASETTVDVANPSNGQHCLSIPAGCKTDVDSAVASSRRAFEDGRWSEAPLSYRKRALHQLADLIASKANVLDGLDAGEMGKPISVKLASASAAANLTRFFAEAVDKLTGDVYGSDRSSFIAQRRVPRGVIAAVVPWNFPTYAAMFKIAPALAAGNCVVVKPSEMSSRSAILLGQLALQAGVPPGVLNVVPGLGQTAGRALGLHHDVDMMTFTGSTDVGRLMLQYAGQSNMKVTMAECGGKSPQIVFADGVDLDVAADAIATMLLTNQGQICSVGSRLLVQRSIEAIMVDKIAARFGQIVMGDALNPRTTFGPMASEKQCARVEKYVETARTDGARLAVGGGRALRDTGGFFFEPTIVCGVSQTARIIQEEVFGPVLSVMPFEDESHAIRLANETMYGLAAYVWTKNLSTGMKMMKGLRSSVWINATSPKGEGAGYSVSSEPYGQSGVGTEGGLAGMESYLRRQRVTFNHE